MNLNEMEKLCEGATCGPWDTSDMCPTELNMPRTKSSKIVNHADARFICAARDFVPWAIERITKLEKVAEAAEKVSGSAVLKEASFIGYSEAWSNLIDALEALEK